MSLLNQILADASSYAWTWGFAFAFMTAFELLLGRGEQSIVSRLPGLLFWALWLPVSQVIYTGFHALWTEVGIRPLFLLPLKFTWLGAAAVIATPVAAAAVYDFFFYWCHRTEHRWLWRFHAVHHSIRDLNAVNAFHHITEPIFQTALILLPASLIVSETGSVASFMVLLLYLQANYIHSPTRIHFGPARAFFVDNRFHRIHHSLEERHFDRNFGAFTTIWDRLFGTAHFPAPDEWPDVGLAAIDQPHSVGEWLSLPWRYGRTTAAPPSAAVARPG